MSWLTSLLNLFRPAKDLVEVFHENEEHRAERQHDEAMADTALNRDVLNQFAAEFANRSNRTRWDSFVDGLNRLPRPVITLAVLGFFLLAPIFPERVTAVAKAYEVIPTGFWALLSIIVGFYFGGRMQLKAQDFHIKGSAVAAARDLVKTKKRFREFVTSDDTPEELQFRAAADRQGGRLPNETAVRWRRAHPSAVTLAQSDDGPSPEGDYSAGLGHR